MKPNVFFFRSCALILMSLGVLKAAEVASPSNLFPSPTGSYENQATSLVAYGTVANVAFKMVQVADRSAPPPTGTTPVTYVCGTTSHFRVLSGGSTAPVFVSVPMDLTFRLTPSAMGVPGEFELEVLAMTATGLPGGLMIRESPTLASLGTHTVRQVPSGNYYISSFFDVFTEISSDGGVSWTPGDAALHLELTEPEMLVATENKLPPAGSVIKVPGKIEFPNLVQLSDLQLKPSPATITSLPTRGSLYQADERGKAMGQVSLDGGVTFAPFECDYAAACKYRATGRKTEARFYDEELLSLDLSGGTLPAGMRIRESPTKASLGCASSRLAADGLYRISSYFDIFTECSLNNGATWSPNDGPPCYIVNSHTPPITDLSAFGFNPTEVTSAIAKPQPSTHKLELMAKFENGDIPTQEDLIEYPTGTIIRGLSFLLPSSAVKPPALGSPPVTQSIGITVQGEVSSDGGQSYEPVHGLATASVRVNAVAVGAGASAAMLRHEIEWLALDFSTTLSSGGTLHLRESPTKASLGKTAMRPAPDGTAMISSAFDIFTEISLDNGATWRASGPVLCFPVCHLKTVQVTGSSVGPIKWMAPESLREQLTPTSDFPPAESVLACPSDIYASNGVVLRRVMIHKIHNGSPLPNPSASKTFAFTTTASGEFSMDGGVTFHDWVGSCTGSIGLTNFLDDDSDGDGITDVRFFNGELLSLDLSGGGLGAVRLRESPTKASLGRTSVRTTPSNSFGTLSFFDVFTEISTDNGATWTPSSGLPVSFGFKDRSREHMFMSVCLPVCGDYVSSDPVELSGGITLYRFRKRPEILFQAWDESLDGRVIPSGGTIEGDISTDGGATRQSFQTTYSENLLAGVDRADGSVTLECRDFACTIASGGMSIRLRESPSLPSLGRTRVLKGSGSNLNVGELLDIKPQPSVITGPKGQVSGYMVESFFDIFTEVSFDNGLIWSPRSNLLRLHVEPTPTQDNAFATDFFPPRDGSFEMEPGSPPIIYSSSTVIGNVRVRINELQARPQHPPSTPTPVTQITPVIVEADLSLDGGATWSSVSGAADCTLHVTRHESDPTQPIDLSITMEGLSTTLGTVMLRESPSKASLGKTSIRTKLADFNANGNLIDSFFDVFTEISLDGGATWLPAAEACTLALHRDTTGVFDPSKWQPLEATHRAVDPDFEIHFEGVDATISGLTLDRPISIQPEGTAPPPAPGATLKRQCLFNMGLKGRASSAATQESRRMKVEVGWSCTTDEAADSTATVLNTEITSFDIVGGELPGGMRLRESPTRASTGRTTINDAPGGYALQSFFDIFTEISLDGGHTWHAAVTPLKMETVDASPPKRFGIGGSDPLPPLFKIPRSIIKTYFETGDKPTQAQFGALIDSSLNFLDDRHLFGLREYDAELEYIAGDTGVYNKVRARAFVGSDLILSIGGIDTDSRKSYDIEIKQFDMSGGTMPAGMKLRESPTLPSRGRCERVTNPDGSVSVMSFFDVFTEISHDNGTTWSASDLPLHFEAMDNTFSSLTHSDQFVPQGIYKQTNTPVRCGDGSCVATLLSVTSPPAPLPTDPGIARFFPHIKCPLTSSFARTGASSVSVSAEADLDINLTLADTVGGTRYFDAEVLKLALTGTISPAEFRLRESPTKASLGRHIVTDVGDGNYRISSYFDIFTEISVDGGQTWSECDVPLHLDLAAPEIDVQLDPGIDLVAGTSTIDFGYMLTGSTATRNVLISNHGNIMVSDFGMARLGTSAADFGFASPSSTTLAPGATIKVPVTFTAGTPGIRTATLRITSNDADESPFDITLTARALSPNADDDGDGLTNQQEMNLITNPLYTPDNPGTNPLHDDHDRLAFFRNNGLFLASDVQALNMDVPLLQKLPGSNQFKLVFGVQKSADLIHFEPFPLSAPQSMINTEGKLEFLFTVPDSASFFRVQAP